MATCTSEKMANILASLADGASISRAARAAGVPRSTLHLWHSTDKVFAVTMDEVQRPRPSPPEFSEQYARERGSDRGESGSRSW
jgi:transposase-like protein